MKYFVYCRKSTEDEDRQVQSIDSQERELQHLFAAQRDVEVVATLTEAQSAMTPGRPIFDEMINRIELGEAEGLIAWAPDRLARNSVDGGRVIYFLDTGKIKDLKFATFTFENTPSGKFMLSILFGQSKYYSDALSENVKRGIRTKLENGWMPGMAKIGYLNDPATHTIVSDPVRLPLLREMWQMILSGHYSVREICEEMDARGLRTLTRKREGGRSLALSSVYKIFTSPFYAGLIPWRGKLYPGKHEPIITMDEFDAVQRLLRRTSQRRPQERDFVFTGMIRCGECGFMVTAEEKVNRHGSHYIYYHCTKRRPDYRCRQRSVQEDTLLDQIQSFLEGIAIPPPLHGFALQMATRGQTEAARLAEIEKKSQSEALAKNETARRNLTKLRISDQISEAEFETERHDLENERVRLESRVGEVSSRLRFEPGKLSILFSIRAAKWFREGDNSVKRQIFKIAGSNPVLMDQKLRIDAADLFRGYQKADSILALRGVVEDVRTRMLKVETVYQMLNIQKLLSELESDEDRLVA